MTIRRSKYIGDIWPDFSLNLPNLIEPTLKSPSGIEVIDDIDK